MLLLDFGYSRASRRQGGWKGKIQEWKEMVLEAKSRKGSMGGF